MIVQHWGYTCTLSGILLTVSHLISCQQIVNTPSGPVKGLNLIDQETGQSVFQFRGIRFGKSTAGERRFRKPEPVDKWTDTYDATKFGKVCPQLSLEFIEGGVPEISEDCLFLNVYVPRAITLDQKRSVMVWIHGGGLVLGHSHFYDGTRVAVDGDVIFVSINYRLNVFGYMALNHPSARGNYGFWDQKLALQWVHDNIAAFGGDPQSVTIFGESAGGWSVSYQSLIPSNKGLFQRVIAQSGVVSRFGLVRQKTIDTFLSRIPKRVNCSADNISEFVECLRQVSVDDLLKATDYWQDLPEDVIATDALYGPSVDMDLFPKHPIVLLEDPESDVSKFFSSLDFITGTMEQEGSLLYMEMPPHLMELYNFNISVGVPVEFVCKGMIKPFVEAHFESDDAVYDKMCKFYTSETPPEKQALRAADCYADILFTPATAEMLNFHSRHRDGSTYQYVFTQLNPKPFGPPAPEWFKTNGHADELIFLFRIDEDGKGGFFDFKMNPETKQVSDMMIKYWTSFAKTGIPDAGTSALPWLQYDARRRLYLDLQADPAIKQDAFGDTVRFWLKEMLKNDLKTPYKIMHDEL